MDNNDINPGDSVQGPSAEETQETTKQNINPIAMAVTEKSGYVNGSDLLLFVGGKAVGHCTTHTMTYNSETKDRAVKPLASKGISAGLWKGKGVTGLSISISFEGLCNYDETETGFKDLLKAWKTGESVEVKAFERESSDGEGPKTPYLVGKFVIASLEQSAPAQDDTTYSGSLENDGEPTTLDESVITQNAA